MAHEMNPGVNRQHAKKNPSLSCCVMKRSPFAVCHCPFSVLTGDYWLYTSI